jgi:hypothetical protein
MLLLRNLAAIVAVEVLRFLALLCCTASSASMARG